MLGFLRQTFKYFARQLVWGLIDDLVDWIRAKLRDEWLARDAVAEAQPAALPEAQTVTILEADAVEVMPSPVRIGA